MNMKISTVEKARIIQIGVALAILLVVAAVLLLPPLLKKKSIDKGETAFGKLPAGGSSSRAATLEARPAIGMPDGEGFWEPRFEYSWSGGAWPDLPDKMAVYRRAAGDISLAEAKDLAAKFGLTGDPLADEPVPPMEQNGASGPGEPPAQVAPEPMPEPRPLPAPTPFKSYRFYDQASGRRLEISATDGRFSYMVEGAWQAVEEKPGGRPSDDRAKEIAVGFLKDKGLLPGTYTGPFAAQSGVVSTGVVSPDGAEPSVAEPKIIEPPYVEIQFGKKLGDYNIVEPSGEPSRYIASVTVGPGDVIMAAAGEIPGVLEESAYPLMGPAAAFEDVKEGTFGGVRALGAAVPMLGAPADTPVQSPAGEGNEGAAAGEPGAVSSGTGSAEPGQPPVEPVDPAPEPPVKPEPVKVELNKIDLAYMLVTGTDGVGYYQPAYVFSGWMGEAASRSAYSVAIPAVAEKFIKK